MSKLTSINKLIVEDYPDNIRSWFTKLALTLNPFLEQSYSILVNGITFKDNIKGQVIKQSLPAGVSELSVSWSLNEKPTSVTIGQILKADGDHPTNQITMTWKFKDNQIKLKFFNLNSSTKYLVTMVAQV